MSQKLLRALQFFLFLLVGVSCTIDVDITDLTEASSTLNFANPDDFDFDENYVEIKNNKISLKPLDLEHSGDDFSRGSHVGSHVLNGNISILNKPQVTTTHVNSIFQGKSGNLLRYLRFENNFTDETDNFDGLPNGAPSFASGLLGKGLSSSHPDFVSTGTVSLGNADHITISFWLNTLHASHQSLLGGWSGPVPNPGVQFSMGIGGTAGSVEMFSINSGLRISTSNTYNDGKWHNIVYSYNKTTTTMKIYVDGAEQASGSSGIINWEGWDLDIGASGGSGLNFSGSLDEFAIWTDHFSPEEVQQLYEGQLANFTELSSVWTPKWDSVVGYWKMDGNWQDSSGNGIHGVVTGAPVFNSSARVGSATADIPGVGNSVEFIDPGSILSTQAIRSWGGWVKVDTHAGASVPVFQKPFTSHVSPFYDIAITYTTTPMEYRCWASKTSGAVEVADSPPLLEIADGKWRHIICTYDDIDLKMYIDGRLVSEINSPGTKAIENVSSLYLGIYGNPGTGAFEGHTDDIAIWNQALDYSDVSIIYNQQKQKYAGHFDSEVVDLGSFTSKWPDLSWSTTLPFGKELVGDFDNDGNPDSESSSDYPGFSGDLTNGNIGYWSFNESVLNSAPGSTDFEDKSGIGNHFIESGGVKINSNGVLGRAISFDGTDDIVEDPTLTSRLNTNWEDDFTTSLWVKIPQTQVDMGTSVNRILLRSTASRFDAISFQNQTSGSPGEIFYTRSDGANTTLLRSMSLVNDSQYHHIVVKKEANNISLYIDGVFADQGPDITSLTENFQYIVIGRNIGGGSALSGSFDELAVWERSLTDTEVQELYRRGANRVKLQVKSCVDSSCNCKSFSTSPQGSISDCDGDGITNAEDHDDIHIAQFVGPGGDGTTHFSELLNRPAENINFVCDENTTDSNDDICVQDEILLSGSPKPTSPLFSFEDFPEAGQPAPNRYFQYRVNMEADENTACDGEPCLPELTSVNLNPTGEPRYFGQSQVITSKKPIFFDELQSIEVEGASSCVGFQLSPDGTNFYSFANGTWKAASTENDTNTAEELSAHITKFSDRFAPGNLYFKTFLKSTDTRSPCSVGRINLDYRDENI